MPTDSPPANEPTPEAPQPEDDLEREFELDEHQAAFAEALGDLEEVCDRLEELSQVTLDETNDFSLVVDADTVASLSVCSAIIAHQTALAAGAAPADVEGLGELEPSGPEPPSPTPAAPAPGGSPTDLIKPRS